LFQPEQHILAERWRPITIDSRLLQIAHKLHRLKTADPSLDVFGAKVHRYDLQPCLTQAQLHSFEQEHAVSLPAGFRAFLCQIGGSGAGPAYGLLPITDWLGHVGSTDGPFELAAPFPYTTDWNPVEAAIQAQGTLPDDQYRQLCDECDRDEHVNGTIAICHLGCGHLVLLVVAGPERGHLWGDSRGSDKGLYPLYSRSGEHRISFLEWYERWLGDNLDR
jgi:hypothetical protein